MAAAGLASVFLVFLLHLGIAEVMIAHPEGIAPFLGLLGIGTLSLGEHIDALEIPRTGELGIIGMEKCLLHSGIAGIDQHLDMARAGEIANEIGIVGLRIFACIEEGCGLVVIGMPDETGRDLGTVGDTLDKAVGMLDDLIVSLGFEIVLQEVHAERGLRGEMVVAIAQVFLFAGLVATVMAEGDELLTGAGTMG